MSHPTFYIPPDQIDGDQATLTGDELRHARVTLRLGVGEAVRVVDGEGGTWEARIQSMGKGESGLRLDRKTTEPAPDLDFTVAMGVVQGERFDWAIQKGTELGVSCFIPLLTERSELRSRGSWKRQARLHRVIVSACKQSGRARFPVLSDPVFLTELDTAPFDLSVVFWEEPSARSLKEAVAGVDPPGSCLMVIGPVGGLTPDEAALLRGKGCIVAGMGPRILRTETAVTAGAALVQYLWGDMG